MEHTEDIVMMLDQISDPAFLVRDGIITQVNPSAAQLLIDTGSSIQNLLATGVQEYADFQDGYLALTLKLGTQPCNASVTRLENCDLFVLNHQQVGNDTVGQQKALGSQMPAAIIGLLRQALLFEPGHCFFHGGKGQQKPLFVFLGINACGGAQPHHQVFSRPLPIGDLLDILKYLSALPDALNIALQIPDDGKAPPGEIRAGVRAKAQVFCTCPVL